MKNNMNAAELFDQLEPIQSTPTWETALQQRLSEVQVKRKNAFVSNNSQWLLLLLLALNIFTLYGFTSQFHSQQKRREMKNLANEFLIQSDSSKF